MLKKNQNIFLLFPNIVTMTRTIVFLLSVYMVSIQKYALFWFVIGVICNLADALDGYLARKRNECTQIGQILDFTFDRIALMALMFLLSLWLPAYWFIFFLVATLDVLAHYLHLKTVCENGERDHKKNQLTQASFCLRWYYKNKTNLFLVCFFHDAFFWLLVLSQLIQLNPFFTFFLYFSSLFAALKTVIHIQKVVLALKLLAERESR